MANLEDLTSPRLFLRDGNLYFRPAVRQEVPDIIGAKYRRHLNAYQVPKLRSEVLLIQDLFPNVKLGPGVESVLNPKFELKDYPHPNYDKLYPFQKEAVSFLVESPMPGALLALSPRLGKTVCTIVALDILEAKDVLIVAPLSLLGSWYSEVQKWSIHKHASIRHRATPTAGWNITNYDTVVNRLESYLIPWEVLVVDESLLIKNRHTLRFRSIYALGGYVTRRRWLLSGSPTSKNASDLWSQFRVVYPEAFTSFWRFAEQTCMVNSGVTTWEIIGTKPTFSLQNDYSDIAFVKSWKEVCAQLPKTINLPDIEVRLDGQQRKAYVDMHAQFVAQLNGVELPAHSKMAQMTRLQQIASNLGNVFEGEDVSAKTDALIDLLEGGAFEFPLLIWVHWIPGAYALYSRLKSLGLRVGIATGKERDPSAAIEAYKAGTCDVLVLSIGVGKYGHTLSNTSTMIYYDLTFDGDAYFQSSHRVLRPDLDHPVGVVRIRAKDTVDELVEENLIRKMVDISRITNADLLQLLKPLSGVVGDSSD